MTNLRDDISLVVNEYGDGLPDDVALEAADAILATIKASVPPLVWRAPYGTTAVFYDTIYEIEEDDDGCYYFVINGNFEISPSCQSPKEAQAEANAHHVAQVTDWMMK